MTSKKLVNSIVDVPGLRVGHAQDTHALTGCTVVLCEAGAVGGVDQRGGAPGTRETDALHNMHLVTQVHAILLTGGSAFGLDAAGGVMRYLEERGVGFDTGAARVPIVPAAVLFDLGLGRADIRPDAAMGYRACQDASEKPPAEGNVGAGCGATVGKILGPGQATKSGIGSASIHLGGGLVIGALAAVNALGDVINPHSGEVVAGVRSLQERGAEGAKPPVFANTLEVMKAMLAGGAPIAGGAVPSAGGQGTNTVIGVVATNAGLTKEQANKVAQMAHDGLARTVCPVHTMLDGDTIFALSTGSLPADVSLIGTFAAEVFAEAVLSAVRAAEPAGGLPSASSLAA